MNQDWGLIRIDDRLIHGQVVAVWCRHRPFTRIVIVDDSVAADPFMQEVMRLAAPPGLQVDVLSLEEAIRRLPQDSHPRETTMILLRSPQAALRLYEGGIRYTALNVGGLGIGPGRRPLFRHIAVSDEEMAALKALAERGVDITFLTVPGEKARSFGDLVEQPRRSCPTS
ncbi:MAG: PTS sugar transporter subunit IIB [Anaerolineae bacterium]